MKGANMRVGNLTKLALAGTLALATIGAAAAPAMASESGRPVAAPRAAAGTMTSAVDGTFTDALGGAGKVTGRFTPANFAVQDGKAVATGTLHSVLTDSAGKQVGTADTPVTVPVQLPGAGGVTTLASCNVLHLVLGPLDLNLLGLVVHLNTVVLDITAQSGPGNLLGNLLCAITNLLNGGLNLPIGTLTALLNAILALLSL
jgi:hypothetical protein